MKKNPIAYFAVILCFSLIISAQVTDDPKSVQIFDSTKGLRESFIQIMKAEDELRFDKVLENLLKSPNPTERARAALAAGRIGDEKAIPFLVEMIEKERSENAFETAVFALGEIESIAGADAVLKILNNLKNPTSIRARAIEAAGKIAAANAKDEKAKILGAAILENLEFENKKRSGPFMDVIEFGLTAVLRARPADAEKTVVEYTRAYTPQIRANALNTLARLRAKNANENARELLQKDADAVVRANAARVLGAAEDKDALELLLTAALSDQDSRVRVSAIRSIGSLKDTKSAEKLLERGEKLLVDYKKSKFANPIEKSELLEISSALGRILPNSNNERAIKFLSEFDALDKYKSAEIEIALAQIAPQKLPEYLQKKPQTLKRNWQAVSVAAQAVAEFAKLDDSPTNANLKKDAVSQLQGMLERILNLPAKENPPILAIPDVLRAYGAFKPEDLSKIAREYLKHKDLFARATAAELLSEQTATKENTEALKNAFASSLKTDKTYNDAQLAILSALVKLDKTQSIESLKLALEAPDYLVRKHAANLIKQNELTEDFPNLTEKVGTVRPYDPKTGTKLGQVLNKDADYRRAAMRQNGKVRAILTTEKGKFTIELFPKDAPLTVDNFIKLAKSKYFNGVSVHRVVANFVMQDGDPRGDGNGGPGWSIRCEINMLPYERGAVGMALSGKDTGGSQWFVTHSPQPHLDGGYTVFGKVNESDMKIVDSIVRGDKILKVEIIEKT